MSTMLRRLRSDTRYLLSAFPLTLIGFVLLVVGFALGLGTSLVGIGLAVLVVTLAFARRLGDVERRALPDVLGHQVAWPHYPEPPDGAGAGRRMRATLGCGRYWLDLLHGVVIFPVTVAFFAITLAWWAATLVALTWPLYGWILRGAIPEYTDVPHLIGLGDSYLVASAFYFIGGVLLAVVLAPLVRMLALTRARLGQVILTAAEEDTAPVQDPSGGRAEGAGPVASLRRLGTDTGYLLFTFPLALVGFVLPVAGFALGLGTTVIGIGFAVLALTLYFARRLADVERRALPAVLGHTVARPRYKAPEPGAGPVRRLAPVLTSGQYWLDLLYTVAIFPVTVVCFALTLAWWGATLIALTWPLYGWVVLGIPGNGSLPELLGLGEGYLVASAFYLVGGALLAVVLPLLVRGLALTRARLGQVMLTGVGELHDRIDDLSESRAAAVSAEAGALRRLERDIHDGPQQRLVHLAMELSRAQRQLGKDVDSAQATISGAITATRETLEELRALSRGIAPPILSDRGLAPALAALTSRCPVPVELHVDEERRYSDAVENAVYFVAAEALTNVAKHSHATAAEIRLNREGDRLLLTITDNGVGGAHTAKGHGLAGLNDRVRAVEGDLVVRSPEGGPTVIVMEAPCA